MAQTLTCMLAHVVFSTKHRAELIRPEIETSLFQYMGGIVSTLGSRCLAINGTANHVHLLVSLAKPFNVGDLVREVKKGSSRWIKTQGPGYRTFRWQDGYGAFSVSRSVSPAVKRYIDGQKARHRKVSFEDEFLALVRRHEIEYDERYLWT